jgi:diaminopropionate ammonia-lyase
VAIDDAYALEAMRRLAQPVAGDAPVVAGETGGAGLGVLLAARDDARLRRVLGLEPGSRVLLIGSEGDTDPVIYRKVVGRTAEEVLA